MPYYSMIGWSRFAYITCPDDKTVFKGHQVWEYGKPRLWTEGRECEDELAREAQVYEYLGQHPRILRFLGMDEFRPDVHSIKLELAPLGDLRKYIRHWEKPPESVRLRMALDIAEGVAYIHSRGVFHRDLSCRNFFLFTDLRVKIGDFGGSSIEQLNMKSSTCEEAAYELPQWGREFDERSTLNIELFALGSAIYEAMMWKKPHEGKSEEEILDLHDKKEFPSLDGLSTAHIIRPCWNEEMGSVDEVIRLLREQMELLGGDEVVEKDGAEYKRATQIPADVNDVDGIARLVRLLRGRMVITGVPEVTPEEIRQVRAKAASGVDSTP